VLFEGIMWHSLGNTSFPLAHRIDFSIELRSGGPQICY